MDFVLRPYQPRDQDEVVALWELCALTRSWNDPYRDIERKQVHDADNLMVLEKDGQVIGSIMIGYDGHRGLGQLFGRSIDALVSLPTMS